jgi:hypothetical protein
VPEVFVGGKGAPDIPAIVCIGVVFGLGERALSEKREREMI